MYVQTEMDRTYWVEAGDFLPGEKTVVQQVTVRLYDGEEKVGTYLHGILIIDHLLSINSLSLSLSLCMSTDNF